MQYLCQLDTLKNVIPIKLIPFLPQQKCSGYANIEGQCVKRQDVFASNGMKGSQGRADVAAVNSRVTAAQCAHSPEYRYQTMATYKL